MPKDTERRFPAVPLALSLWDFSWYTMAAPGEPFDDLGSRLDEALERGFNGIRICAMPLLLFGNLRDSRGEEPWRRLGFSGLGRVGVRTRWYSCRGGIEFDGRARLAELLRGCAERGISVVLSSWEFQQVPAFISDPVLRASLGVIPAADRFMALARAWDALLGFVEAEGLSQSVAYVELHNEIEFGRLAELAGAEAGPARIMELLRGPVEEALLYLQARHPETLVSSCHTLGRPYSKALTAPSSLVAHFHLYVDGVVQELVAAADLDAPGRPFPNPFVSSLLREDAPPFADWTLPRGEEDRLAGNPVGLRLLYLHDWADGDRWDRALYDRWGKHRISMERQIDERLLEVADLAKARGVPAAIGEGYVGYTPLLASFEEGPVGKGLAERAIRAGIELGFAAMTPCSNCAPHHPFWADAAWQRRWNRRFIERNADLVADAPSEAP